MFSKKDLGFKVDTSAGIKCESNEFLTVGAPDKATILELSQKVRNSLASLLADVEAFYCGEKDTGKSERPQPVNPLDEIETNLTECIALGGRLRDLLEAQLGRIK